MRKTWTGLAAAAAVWACAAPAAQAAPYLEELQAAVGAAFDSEDCNPGKLKRLAANRAFKDLESAQRAWAYLALAVCDEENRTKWARLSTAEPDAETPHWRLRLADDVYRKDFADSFVVLDALAARKTEPLNKQIDDDLMVRLIQQAQDEPATTVRLMDALDRADWSPASPFLGADWGWADLVAERLKSGDVAGSRRALARIVDPVTLLGMRLDKRFDTLVAAEPARFDILAVAEARLATERKALAAQPRDGDGVSSVANSLMLLRRHAEALSLAEEALKDSSPLKGFDGEDKRNWVANAKASALLGLGRYDEAIAIAREAANLKEGGQVNVSQTINLSGYLNEAGRHEEAIATLAPFDWGLNPSPYGVMWVAAERTCAYARLQRPAEMAKALAKTKELAKENEAARAKALLCAGDLDGVAASFISRLNDPEDRRDALIELSRFAEPEKPTAMRIEMKRRMDQVRERPDVTSAIAAVGRTTSLPLYGGAVVDSY